MENARTTIKPDFADFGWWDNDVSHCRQEIPGLYHSQTLIIYSQVICGLLPFICINIKST